MYKTRTKLVTEQYGGSCPGWDKVEKDCNTHKCPGKLLFSWLHGTNFNMSSNLKCLESNNM